MLSCPGSVLASPPRPRQSQNPIGSSCRLTASQPGHRYAPEPLRIKSSPSTQASSSSLDPALSASPLSIVTSSRRHRPPVTILWVQRIPAASCPTDGLMPLPAEGKRTHHSVSNGHHGCD